MSKKKPYGEWSEADFQAGLIELANMLGWKVQHTRPAWTGKGYRTPVQGDGHGFPDNVLVKPPRVIFAELKTETGELTKGYFNNRGRYLMGQVDWIELLTGCEGIEVYVWRPSDLEHIAEILQGK